MALARARRDGGMNYWPGFVDVLSSFILGIIFLLTVFVFVQFYLTQEVTGKDTALNRLNAQIAQLTELLSLEKTGKLGLDEQLNMLRSSLAAAEGERDRYKGLYDGAGGGADAQGKAAELSGQLDAERRLSTRALAQVEVLNQQISALRRQLAALEETLDASEKRDKESQSRIADLGQRLNVALAQRVQELSRYRSDFFGRLRVILGNRPDIRIVGDRFVFQSEVFFDTGRATLDKPEGLAELDGLATALLELEKKIPGEIPWVLRVDGHTDVRGINSPQFRNNWELSVARAISVVQYLIAKGVSPQRLVAAGFGEFQPIDTDKADENAAIELWRRTWQLAYPHINFDERVDWWRERWREELVPAATITVAEAGGKMLGFVTVDPRTFDIDQTVVAPEAWGLGVAAALIAEAKRISPAGLDLHVNKDNARAIRFYEKQGFVVSGEALNWRSGAPVHKMSWRPLSTSSRASS